MASGRLPYSPTTVLGAKIAALGSLGVQFRTQLEEMSRRLEKNGDNTAIAAEAGGGMDATQAQTLRDLVARAAGETADVVLTGQGIAAGAQSNTRALLDSIG